MPILIINHLFYFNNIQYTNSYNQKDIYDDIADYEHLDVLFVQREYHDNNILCDDAIDV